MNGTGQSTSIPFAIGPGAIIVRFVVAIRRDSLIGTVGGSAASGDRQNADVAARIFRSDRFAAVRRRRRTIG